jgi:predicted nucleotidyltransferase
MVNSYKNVVRIKVLEEALSKLKNKFVYVGGAVVELYCDDPARAEVRPTDDVDVVVELLNYGSYAILEENLSAIGINHHIDDTFQSVICRYKYHDIIIDIMPTDERILSFTNIWYKDGLQNSISYDLDDNLTIQIFPLPYFIASKFEALKSERHGKDYRYNSDFEDIIYIFDNRINIKRELIECTNDVKIYLQKMIIALLQRPYIEEEIIANLEYFSSNQRKDRILAIWKSFINS